MSFAADTAHVTRPTPPGHSHLVTHGISCFVVHVGRRSRGPAILETGPRPTMKRQFGLLLERQASEAPFLEELKLLQGQRCEWEGEKRQSNAGGVLRAVQARAGGRAARAPDLVKFAVSAEKASLCPARMGTYGQGLERTRRGWANESPAARHCRVHKG